MPTAPPVVLCLSGLDPTGGAGIQADIEAVRAQGGHPATVATCFTHQDSRNVYAIEPVAADEVIGQVELLFEDLPIAAIKLGMLGSAEVADAVAALLARHRGVPVVLDPVLRASGGAALADQPLINVMMEKILPATTVMTPNHREAQQLAAPKRDIDACAADLLTRGAAHVLVTGGDVGSGDVTNTLFSSDGRRDWQWPRLPHRYHGSGCTLAAALAARLAHGDGMETAAEQAQAFAWRALQGAYALGRGQHFPRRLSHPL